MTNTTEGNKPKLLVTEDDFENQKFLEMFLKEILMLKYATPNSLSTNI